MNSTVVVDDHILLQILLGQEPSSLRPHGAIIATTGLWYHRLCRALANDTVTGVMSRQLGNANMTLATAAIGSVIELPESIQLVSLRSLAWPMAEILTSGVRLNLLSLEALAAAENLQAELCMAEQDDNPPLREAAARRGVNIRLITG